jgi:hypothetical protein
VGRVPRKHSIGSREDHDPDCDFHDFDFAVDFASDPRDKNVMPLYPRIPFKEINGNIGE